MSVVMPTFNRAYRLESAIRPLLRDRGLLELIVVDDGSRDGSSELLERVARDDPRLKPVTLDAVGAAAARQAGVEAAAGEVVLLLDDDVRAEPGLVAGHARHHAAGGRLVVLGYMPVRLPERRRPGAFTAHIYSDDYEKHVQMYERDPRRVLTHLWGGNVSIRRMDCLAIGLANPAFPHRQQEDREFGLRCLEAGLTGVFDRSLRAEHLYERTLAASVSEMRAQGKARVLLHRLHPAIVEPVDRRTYERGLPALARIVVRAGRRPRLAGAVTTALRATVVVAGRARAWRLEESAGRLLRRVEQQRGSLTART